jgi:putative nucleotide binding protein
MSVDDGSEPRTAVVLDVLPHGRPDDDRPQYQKSPLAEAIETSTFRLLELVLNDGGNLTIADEVRVDPPEPSIDVARDMPYEDLSGGARSELEHVVNEVIEDEEDRFVEFYNEAGPVTVRLHQLNLLPGVGDKLRDNILDARKRQPFESLEDLDERVSGLHNPKGTIVERILEELRDEDVKYKLFVGQQ